MTTATRTIGYFQKPNLRSYFKKLLNDRRKNQERRNSVRHLRGLNSHLLKDIGMDRSEIVSVVYSDPSERRRNMVG